MKSLTVRSYFSSKFAQLATALMLAFVLVGPAAAVPGTATAVVTAIQALAVPLGLVAAATLILLVGMKAYKHFRRAL